MAAALSLSSLTSSFSSLSFSSQVFQKPRALRLVSLPSSRSPLTLRNPPPLVAVAAAAADETLDSTSELEEESLDMESEEESLDMESEEESLDMENEEESLGMESEEESLDLEREEESLDMEREEESLDVEREEESLDLERKKESLDLERKKESVARQRYVKMRLPGGFAAQRIWGTGRKKCAIARVVLQEGTGKVFINYRDAKEYLQGNPLWLQYVKTPLVLLGYENTYDVFVKAHGGGLGGQAQAICLGVARALLKVSEDHRTPLREDGLLTRDSRIVERKKVGLKKARKAPQYSKR